ncbi:MAG: LysM peptidoglycan-binding domain-containing protein [Planctomycetota bacterium]
MAHETKVGLLIGLALILLVGLVLSDLFTGGDAEPVDGQTPTDFGGEAQAGIYPDPPTVIYTDEQRDALGTHPGLGSPLRPEPARDYQAPTRRPAPNETRIPDHAPSRDADPPTPELDTLQARRRDALATIDSTLEMFALANEAGRSTDADRLPTEAASAARQLAADPVERDHADDDPTRVAEVPALPTTTAGSVTIHTVQAGQTLAGIARQHYGNPEYARVLAQTNPDKLDRDGGVRPGVRLDIPPLGSPAFSRMFEPVHADHAVRVDEAMPALPRRPADQREAALTEITVEPGDTLSELAAEHLGSATRWDQLLAANTDRLDSPQSLRSGMKLRIPATASGNPERTSSEPRDTIAREVRETRAAEAASPPTVRDSPRPAPANTYTVQAGDNLTRIAAEFLGDGERWDELLHANADQLDKPENLRVGMVLKLPADAGGAAPPPREAVAPPSISRPARPVATQPKEYTVQAGDNLTRIAARQLGDGDRWRELYEANADQLPSPDALIAGQTLRLP